MSGQRFATLTAAAMTPAQREAAEAIQSGPRGAGLRGPFNALLRSPELCDLVQRVGAYVRFGSALPPALNELAICIVGRKWTAQYEFYAHRRLAIEAGVAPVILDAIAAGARPRGLSADQAAIYEFATSLLETGQVSDAAFKAVQERFGDRGVVDLVGAVGYYTLVSMVLNVDRVPLPEGEPLPLPPRPLS
jgi:4-carboxymuconolactone decarboxylase